MATVVSETEKLVTENILKSLELISLLEDPKHVQQIYANIRALALIGERESKKECTS